MRRYLIAGNWKMNLNKADIKSLLASLKSLLHDLNNSIDVAVFPPNLYLDIVSQEIKLSNIDLGAQNISCEDTSAFTGEVSGGMLGEFNCKYVIIGHSERRAKLGETCEQVAGKFEQAKMAGITPILCVGESEADHGNGNSFAVVSRQIEAVIERVGVDALKDSVIAYEPVWAIGTGKVATPALVQEMHARIRDLVATEVRIIYGGSLKSTNALEIFQQQDVDGGLIGGASLKAPEFSDICHIAMGLAE